MPQGKYSPTVSEAYHLDQEWWDNNGGDDWSDGRDGNYDQDGYDSYGYNKNGVDRLDVSEADYGFATETEFSDLWHDAYDYGKLLVEQLKTKRIITC